MTASRLNHSCLGIDRTCRRLPTEYKQALELIHSSKRPVILAGHGIILSGAMDEVRAFAEKANIPVGLTLLGLGGFPASHPLSLGMMGMHGEAWLNTTIQEADLLIAFGMRFDDRVTGNLKTYAPNAKKIHVEIDRAEVNKNVKVDVALVGDLKAVLRELLPNLKPQDRHEWLAYIDRLKGDSSVRDIQNLPDNGHLYAAHVINDLWRETRRQRHGDRHGRGPAPDVGSPILQTREAAHPDHFRRPRHHGLCPSRGDWREGRPARG